MLVFLKVCQYRQISGYYYIHLRLGWFWSKKNRQICSLFGKSYFKGIALYLYCVKWKMLFKIMINQAYSINYCSSASMQYAFVIKKVKKKYFQLHRHSHNSQHYTTAKAKETIYSNVGNTQGKKVRRVCPQITRKRTINHLFCFK